LTFVVGYVIIRVWRKKFTQKKRKRTMQRYKFKVTFDSGGVITVDNCINKADAGQKVSKYTEDAWGNIVSIEEVEDDD
jgi:hypothetical protein